MFPMIFPLFSHDFLMNFPWFIADFPATFDTGTPPATVLSWLPKVYGGLVTTLSASKDQLEPCTERRVTGEWIAAELRIQKHTGITMWLFNIAMV